MSEETVSACRRLIVPNSALLGVLVLLRADSYWPVSVIVSVGPIRPDSSAASAVIGLNTEPVGYADSVTRSSSGAPFSCEVRAS